MACLAVGYNLRSAGQQLRQQEGEQEECPHKGPATVGCSFF